MRLHGLLGEHRLSRNYCHRHRYLRRSQFPTTDHLAVGGMPPPLDLLAVRPNDPACGEAGLRPQLLLLFTAGNGTMPRLLMRPAQQLANVEIFAGVEILAEGSHSAPGRATGPRRAGND